MKICKTCNIEQPINDFYQKSNVCLNCRKILMKAYYEANRIKILNKQKDYHEKNKDIIKIRVDEYRKRPEVIEREKIRQNSEHYKLVKQEGSKKYNQTPKAKESKKLSNIKHSDKRKKYAQEYVQNNKDKIKLNAKVYYQANKDNIREYQKIYTKNRRQTDPLFKLKQNTNSLIRKSIQRKNFNKSSKTIQILCCSIPDFKFYLESKFESWMTWENYGLYNGTPNYGWDIDHIIPVDTAISEDDIINLNHYTNLQPLCSYINRDIKRNKLI